MGWLSGALDPDGEHEGYAAGKLAGGTFPGYWTQEAVSYVASCECGWRHPDEQPPTAAGEDACRVLWDDHVRAVLAARQAEDLGQLAVLLDRLGVLGQRLRRDADSAQDQRAIRSALRRAGELAARLWPEDTGGGA